MELQHLWQLNMCVLKLGLAVIVVDMIREGVPKNGPQIVGRGITVENRLNLQLWLEASRINWGLFPGARPQLLWLVFREGAPS